jgi:hypothetical protein
VALRSVVPLVSQIGGALLSGASTHLLAAAPHVVAGAVSLVALALFGTAWVVVHSCTKVSRPRRRRSPRPSPVVLEMKGGVIASSSVPLEPEAGSGE